MAGTARAGGPVRYVGADYIAATATLVGQALAMGHRRFGYIGAPGATESIIDRRRGFDRALHGAGELVHFEETEHGDPARQLASIRESRASVVFFGDLAEASAFDDHARATGLAVPGNISIVVLGSRPRFQQQERRFTAYAIPREEMGRQATAMLVRTLTDPGAVEQVLLDCEIVAGETLASPNPTKDNFK